jgi:molybdenum cofactor cytidylyltransferase
VSSGQPDTIGTIGIVILAAGESARMGEPKQLLGYCGRPLLRHAAECALALGSGPVAVVLGAFSEKIRPTLDGLPLLIVENHDWREGMGTSLRTGLAALLGAHPNITAVISMLSDQPLVSTSLLGEIISLHTAAGHRIVASEYDGNLGVPALFARELFPELLALDGASGARQIIRAHRESAVCVPFQQGAMDVDTPADYARLRALR